MLYMLRKPRQHIKKQSIKGPRCKSWTTRKAKCQGTGAFELWWWRILLSVCWKARRSNQSILKEINPEYSLEGMMLKLQSFGHLMGRTDSLEKKNPDAGKDWRQEEKRVTKDEMAGWLHRLNRQEFEQTLGDSEGQGKPGMLQFMALQRVGHDLVTEQQQHIRRDQDDKISS